MRRKRWGWQDKPSTTPATPSTSPDSTSRSSWTRTRSRTQTLEEEDCTWGLNPGCKNQCLNSSWCLQDSNAAQDCPGIASGRILLAAGSRTFVPARPRSCPDLWPSRQRRNILLRAWQSICRSGLEIRLGSVRGNNISNRKLKTNWNVLIRAHRFLTGLCKYSALFSLNKLGDANF